MGAAAAFTQQLPSSHLVKPCAGAQGAPEVTAWRRGWEITKVKLQSGGKSEGEM